MNDQPTLLVAAHGTQSADGASTLHELAALTRQLRPSLRVELCFLDVIEPSVGAALARLDGPVVVVPALLSTGYHVRVDIPAVVDGRPQTAVTSQLGPDPMLSTALAERLATARGRGGETATGPIALVAAGSSDPAAREEVERAAADLSTLLARPVQPMAVTDPDLPLAGMEVASYVLAEGVFADTIALRAREAAASVVSAPIGAHPAVARLILIRYDAGCAQLRPDAAPGPSGMLGGLSKSTPARRRRRCGQVAQSV